MGFKKGSGTVAGTAGHRPKVGRVLCTTVSGPFLNPEHLTHVVYPESGRSYRRVSRNLVWWYVTLLWDCPVDDRPGYSTARQHRGIAGFESRDVPDCGRLTESVIITYLVQINRGGIVRPWWGSSE